MFTRALPSFISLQHFLFLVSVSEMNGGPSNGVIRSYQRLSAVTQCLWTHIRRGSWWAAVIAAEWWQAAEVARRSEGHHWWPSWFQLGIGGRKGWGGTDPRPGRRAEARLHREGWGLHAGQLGTLQEDTNKDTFEFSSSSLCMQGPPTSTFMLVVVRSLS